MPMEASEIERLIREAFPSAEIEIGRATIAEIDGVDLTGLGQAVVAGARDQGVG